MNDIQYFSTFNLLSLTLLHSPPYLGIDRKVPEGVTDTFEQYQFNKIDKLLRDMGKVDREDI